MNEEDLEKLYKYKAFDEILQGISIPDEAKEILIKKYKKILDEKYRLKIDKLEEKLNNSNVVEVSELIKIYSKYINSNIKLNDVKEIDSLLFLSEMSNRKISKIKIQGCIKSKSFNFDKCIQFLKETERLEIIKHENYNEFMDNNKIFYDDEQHSNTPKRDILYRKINDNYFVNNDDYFEKCTDYYFTLYSNIFSIFDLKEISLSLHSNLEKIKESNTSIDTNIFSGNYANNNTTRRNKDNNITMTYQKHQGKNDKYNEYNNCFSQEEELEFLNKELPKNLNQIIYDPTPVLNFIKNRTKNMLSNFNQIVNIENTDIESVELSIKSKFKLSEAITLSRKRSSSSYINKRVVYNIAFYNIDEEPIEENYINNNNNYNNFKKFTNISKKRQITPVDYTLPQNILPGDNYSKINSPQNLNDNSSNKGILQTKSNNFKKDDELYNNKELYKWVNRQRGDIIPSDAIMTGINKTDGKMYIGKINDNPAKVNLDKNNIWNFWAKDLDCNQCGDILITNNTVSWKLIKRGQEIPKNAVNTGRDNHGDLVWIGKSKDNEPGKINCEDYSEKNFTMHNFWCHSKFISSQSAYILIITKKEISDNDKDKNNN